MCKISHSHFFSIMLFVLPFRRERSTYFILGQVCHFVGGLKHKTCFVKNIRSMFINYLFIDATGRQPFNSAFGGLFDIVFLGPLVLVEFGKVKQNA